MEKRRGGGGGERGSISKTNPFRGKIFLGFFFLFCIFRFAFKTPSNNPLRFTFYRASTRNEETKLRKKKSKRKISQATIKRFLTFE